jgi:uncharacterized DUF497 family protein
MQLHSAMSFEWDEAKRLSNLAKHAIDFVDVQLLLDGRPLLTRPSANPSEARFLSTGIIDGRFDTVVWTRRDGAIRVISARRTRDADKRAYRALYGG